jgi:hypothetical protein
MTWYAQSLGVLEFILEREGSAFVRQMADRLREGARMEELLAGGGSGARDLRSFEEEWIRWVGARPAPETGPKTP